MTCAAIHTGTEFVPSALAAIDCLGRTIGTYGYGALSDPGSEVAHALNAMLVVFVALYGYRLMYGHGATLRDGLGIVLRIGLVLTLVGSWPAWRTVINDVVFDGPRAVGGPIASGAGLAASKRQIAVGLQAVDSAIVEMTRKGTGRMTGTTNDGNGADTFDGVALVDQQGLAWGRIGFLLSALGPHALIRVSAGVLLAMTPAMSILLLLPELSGAFFGWLRALAFVALAEVGNSIVLGAQIAAFGPWFREVIALRIAGGYAPSMPTELLVLTLAFLLVGLGMLMVIARLTFQPAPVFRAAQALMPDRFLSESKSGDSSMMTALNQTYEAPRWHAKSVGEAVRVSMRREGIADPDQSSAASRPVAGKGNDAGAAYSIDEPLGTSFRRNQARTSSASSRRDQLA